jgi:phosphohistidine phosphatase
MELYMVRHGIAELRGEKPDDERTLVPKGVKKTRQVAQGLARLGCRPERVGTSPLVRADETAKIMTEVLCPDANYEVCEFLAPGAAASELVKWLANLEERTVMIVGHNPDFPEMAASLLTNGGDAEIEFKKAAVCLISFEGEPKEGGGRLLWLMQPRQLRLIGAY